MDGMSLSELGPETDLLLELGGEVQGSAGDASSEPHAAQRERVLSALKVEIQVALGSVEVPASRLIELSEGAELEMPFNASSPLVISLGGEPLAEAILTAADDGAIELQVIKLLGESDATSSDFGRQPGQAEY